MLTRWRDRYKTPLTALAGAAVAVAIMLLYLSLNPPGGRYNDEAIRRLADERIAEITPTPPLEPEVYAMIRPSVVVISREIPSGAGTSSTVLGSGVVVDLNGSILTAYHVIAGNPSLTVRFFDGTTAAARVMMQQPERDLALIQVSRMPTGVEPAVLAGGVRQGDRVMAIGSPFGLEASVSSGIVSAVGEPRQLGWPAYRLQRPRCRHRQRHHQSRWRPRLCRPGLRGADRGGGQHHRPARLALKSKSSPVQEQQW
jgi:S1-C subfamily serine protease